VSAVELVPKEEGLAQLAGKFSNPQELLSALGGVNPLPDYFRVSAADPHEIPRIAHEASTFQHVERVVYGREVVEKLFALLKWIRWIGWGAIGFLSLAAVAIVGMTVRLNVLSRRKEISVMRYVGATSWFVRWPFILEGMILGFLGAALAVALLGPVYIWLLDGVNRALQFLPLAASPDLLWGVAGILVVAGVLIGGVGSVVSVHRFLKV
ncbi:MAG: ABC transporter permease, partial [Clostridia bacterium]|nr:ABC transporter permease [Clostridia bacterium]